MATPILYEDASLLVIDKPAGVCVIPGRDEGPEDALRGQLEQARGEKLWVVHRLDRDTSGVLLFARTAEAHRALSMAFEARDVDKTYLALVAGQPPATGLIDMALHAARKGRMRPAREGEPGGLPASTRFQVQRRLGTDACLLALVPTGGRQHQLRVQLAYSGWPILGDPVYGKAGERAPRLMLHASRLELTHPSSQRRQGWEAPTPSDFASLAEELAGH